MTDPYRQRLRPAMTPERLAEVYASPHDHRIYGAGHDMRVRVTIGIGETLCTMGKVNLAVDLSCGNGQIAMALARECTGGRYFLGDMAGGDSELAKRLNVVGPIEQTIETAPASGSAMLILSETIEHLDDPDSLLIKANRRYGHLLLSTPIAEGRDEPSTNPEHYWGFDQAAMEEMLTTAGWSIVARVDLFGTQYELGGYDYQIFGCRRTRS